MGIFLRQSHNVKPPRWGSFADVQYAIRVNSEKIYGCDPDDDVLVMPLFWGLPVWDYSGYNNHGTNHGATYKDGSLAVDGINDYVNGTIPELYRVNKTVFARIKMTSIDRINNIFSIGDIPNDSWPQTLFQVNNDNRLASFGTKDGGGFDYLESNETLLANTWYFVTLVNDANNTAYQLYLNNTEVDYLDGTTGTYEDHADTDNNYYIGTGYNNNYFLGLIDEVRIAKAARTADQVGLFNDNKYGLYQPVGRPIWSIPAAPPVGAIMNQFQGANLGADLFNGSLL